MKDRIEDLSIHARRGELGESGLRQLALALESSREARLLHEAGCEFDQSDSVLAGDDAIARRVINRVLKLRDGTRRHRRRSYKMALAMVTWTAAAAAAAPLLVASEVTHANIAHNAEAKLQPLQSNFRHGIGLDSESRLVPEMPESGRDQLPVSVSAASASEPRTGQPKLRTATHAVETSGRELHTSLQVFADANRLRRAGRPTEAIAQYVALQRSFPGSAEAQVADIALGMLRLQSGSATLALGHFHRYLERNASSELVPEALWGQAQAQSALGRTEAARRSYSDLLKRYPGSAYANAARSKLQVEP